MTATAPAPPSPAPAGPAPARPRDRQRSDYSELSRRVREAGLLRRRRGAYAVSALALAAGFAVAGTAFALLGSSWWQLAVAAFLGALLAQAGYLAHDAAHQQVFASPAANQRAALVLANLVVGLSSGWWMRKHSRHHANPNKRGADPDIAPDVVVFTPEDGAAAQRRGGARAWLAAHQGSLLFPLLLLEGLNLHRAAVRHVLAREATPHRALEATLLAVRLGGLLALVFWWLPAGLAVAFLAVQLGVFGLLLGGTFATNHIGMPVVPADARIDFLRRQVLMSRNVRGGRVVDLLMGGLNRQVEHHLFPSMPRANLRRAQPLVREHCRELGVRYTEQGLGETLRAIVRHLDRVGIGARDEAQCPLTRQLRSAR
ncbi:acyl-CoA desaturase [Modestobacter sp. NPDC049651]|uniref:fatty acid desaturase family protein n=1 Tax=unclassified Modestobacter TaxID=2643866 RepID=UPI0033E8175F